MKKNLLLLFVSLAFSFTVAEIFCRVKGNYISYNERTGAGPYTSPFEVGDSDSTHRYPPFQKQFIKRDEFTDLWTANEDGLKEKSLRAFKPGKRLLVLGDSYAEGVGAPPDSSYPRILETLFRQSGDSTLQVINAGIGGSDVVFAFKLLQALLPQYKPDVVLLTINQSDIDDCLIRGGFERFKANGTLQYRHAPWFLPLYEQSFLVRLLVHDMFHYNYNFIRQQDYPAAVNTAKENMAAAIDSVALICRARQVPLHVLFHPFYTHIQHGNFYHLGNLIGHCQKMNISHTDCLAYFTRQGINRSNWSTIYWPQDGHFKSRGYELMARCAYETLNPSQ